MNCNRFLELPKELKIRIINKCYPIPYVRLRQTCKRLDEFCEENRTELGVYCYREDACLDFDQDDFGEITVIRIVDNSNTVKMDMSYFIRNSQVLTKALSGFILPKMILRNPRTDRAQIIRCLIKATPALKIVSLELYYLSSDVLELLETTTWKVGRLEVTDLHEYEHYNTWNVIPNFLNNFKNTKNITLSWHNKGRRGYIQHTIFEWVKRRDRIILHYYDSSLDFAVHIFTEITEVWQANFPKYFEITWPLYKKQSNRAIFGIFDGKKASKAVHLCTFPCKDYLGSSIDIWILKSAWKWQMIRVGSAKFIMETFETKTDFIKKMLALPQEIASSNGVSLRIDTENLSTMFETFERLHSAETMKVAFDHLLDISVTIIKFPRFMELPAVMKLQIIRKCSRTTYVRLRQTCHFLDEFCEDIRKTLRIYNEIYWTVQTLEDSRGYYLLVNRRYGEVTKISLTKENIPAIRNAISGLAFDYLKLMKFRSNRWFNKALFYLLEATPHLRIGTLRLYGMNCSQIKRVLGSSWKINKLKVEGSEDMHINAVMKMDPISIKLYNWSNYYTELDIINLARQKNNITYELWDFSQESEMNILKRIAKNWKEDAHFPQYFHTHWRIEDDKQKTSFRMNISGLCKELIGIDMIHLGCFKAYDYFFHYLRQEKYDLWIGMSNECWQIVSVRRNSGYGNVELYFTFQSSRGKAEFISKLADYFPRLFPNKASHSKFTKTAEKFETLQEVKEQFCKTVNRFPEIWINYE